MMNMASPEQYTILIIDDVPANLAVVSETLARKGYNIKVAVSGEAGLKIASNSLPDLILLDVLLPDIDGFEVCRQLKKQNSTLEIPVIFMTAMSDTEHKVKGFEAGGVDYLTKPVQAEEVLVRVTTHLNLRTLARDLETANQHLEQRVAERTAELAQINESLRSEIKERKHTEHALVKRELEYRNLAENSPDNIVRYDTQCRAIYMNKTILKTIGIAAPLVLNKTPTETGFGEPENMAEYENLVREVLHNGEARDLEVVVPSKGGSNQIHLVRFVAERDAEANITGVLAIGRDITELKSNQEAINHLNRELSAISNCNQVLIRVDDEQELLDEICRIIYQEAGHSLAWVGLTQGETEQTLKPVAWAGKQENHAYLQKLESSLQDSAEQDLIARAIHSGEVFVISDFLSDPDCAEEAELAQQFGFRSAISLPLKGDKANIIGMLNIYSNQVHSFTIEEQRLLTELADDLAFGIVNLRRRAEHADAEEQIRIAATAFEAQEGIIITDAQQRILRSNKAFSEITGYSADEVIGATPAMFKSDRHDQSYFDAMWESIEADGSWQGEIWNRRKSEEVYPGWLTITEVRNPENEVTHFVGTLIDITQRKAAEAEIAHLAYHDPLTLLPNRRLLLERLNLAIDNAEQHGNIGALLFVDLDNFKILNDSRGHDVGDQLLVEIAQDLLAGMGGKDTVARIGGDEFMILLEDLGSDLKAAVQQSARISERITTALGHGHTIEGQEHHITASIGVTFFPGHKTSVRELMKQADIAMYKAKFDGRNTMRYFDPEMQAELADRAELEMALRTGIEEQQLFIVYQPQIHNTEGVVGAELLLRWKHPELGIVSPGQFIPVAEDTGLIEPIGDWVLEVACDQLKKWSEDPARRNLYLAVNVSQRQFEKIDFVDQVREVLERTGAPPHQLKIELTESLLIQDIEGSIRKMLSLKALGVDFSLDDFGTGYSSLAYLTRLPLKQLKIDRSFVSHLPDRRIDSIVTQTIISMARSLGLSVIAEGVETEAQRQFLEQRGCTIYQGFLFSKPIELAEFEKQWLSGD